MVVSSQAAPVVIVTSIFCSAAILTTILRCVVQKYNTANKKLKLDDYFMIIAIFVYMGYSAVVHAGAYYGMGHYNQDLSDRAVMQTNLLWWLGYLLYCVSITLTRISVGFFFRRISAPRTAVHVIIGVNVLSGVIYIFIAALQCTPVQYYWLKAYPGAIGHCVPDKALVGLGYLYGSVCATCDVAFVLLPFFMIRNMNLPRKVKFALVPILGMAGVAAICPLARMAYISNLASPNFLHDTTEIILWSTAEIGLAITASNLATMRPLFCAAKKQLLARANNSNGTLANGAHAIVRSLETIKVGMTMNSSRMGGDSEVELTRQASMGSGIHVQTDIEVAVEENRRSLVEGKVAGLWGQCMAWSRGDLGGQVPMPTRGTADEEMTALPSV